MKKMKSTDITKKVPQQITLTNLMHFNDLLKNSNFSKKRTIERINDVNTRIDNLVIKHSEVLENTFGTTENLDNKEVLKTIKTKCELSNLEKNEILFIESVIKQYVDSLEHIESNLTIDENVRTYKTVFNSRTMGYTQTFFNELIKAANVDFFNNEYEMIKAIKNVINSVNTDYEGVPLSTTTLNRRKTSVDYFTKVGDLI